MVTLLAVNGKIRYRSIGTVLLTALFHLYALSTHIIGGELTYQDLGGGNYAITMKLYRDCGLSNTNGTNFDPDVTIGFFNSSGVVQSSVVLTNLVVTPIPLPSSNPCLIPPPVCVEEGVYTGQVNLPVITGGYTMAYQRCCRNPTILNLNAPNTQGITAVASIPDATIAGTNSSPSFTDFPPIAICANETLVFDHSAVDADGDQLVYSLCDPYQGGSQMNPNPGIPAPPPYPAVAWSPGFSAGLPFSGGSTISIDPASGLLTAIPTTIGQFVVGVCVQEFRNGVLLSEVKRDFQFNVVTCVVPTTSSVQQQQLFCDGLTVDFVNQSSGATDYFWDFGVQGISSDTSILQNPTFTYPDTGTYQVMLVANPSWPCSDTSISSFDIRLPLDPVINAPGIQCYDDQSLEVSVFGEFTSQAQVDWDLGGQSSNQFVSGISVPAFYNQPGDHPISVTVEQYGCTAVAQDTLTLFPNPIADFSWSPSGCAPFNASFTNLSSAWTSMTFDWSFGDGGGSSLTDPDNLYSIPGTYDVSLQVMTYSGCVDTVEKFVPAAVWVQEVPTAGFTADPLEVNILDGLVTVNDQSVDATGWTYTVEGEQYSTPDFQHLFDGGGGFDIIQTVTNDLGCSDTASIQIVVTDHLFYAPNSFSPNGDGINDQWLPSALGVVEYDLVIYDRWGANVFSSNDPKQAWMAEDMPPGTYNYRILLKAGGGFPTLYAGHITLIR